MSRCRQAKIVVSFAVLVLLACVTQVVAQPYTFTHLAGSTASADAIDGTGSAARFNTPEGLAVDSAGNLFVADTLNHTIRKITPSGVVTTFAGVAGAFGSTDGPGSIARLYYPIGIAFDSSGNLFVAEYGNSAIRKITPAGVVSTFAGTLRTFGSVDGTGTAAQFGYPWGLAIDAADNLYVADYGNRNIRKITAGGVVTTLAGTAGTSGNTDGTGLAAKFDNPRGIAVDSAGNVFVGDTGNYRLREITPGGVVTTLGAAIDNVYAAGLAIDGTGVLFAADQYSVMTIAPPYNVTTNYAGGFNHPVAVAVDAGGNLYVADVTTHNIGKITKSTGVISILAGGVAASGSADGSGTAAQFKTPHCVAVDSGGNVYVSDYTNHTIRKITPAGAVTTFAGTAGSYGGTDGTGSAARFSFPEGITVDGTGNVFVVSNDTVRRITPGAVVSTLAGTYGVSATVDGTGSAAEFSSPAGAALDGSGNIYVSQWINNLIRKVTLAGVVTTVAGNPSIFFGEADGTGAAASFHSPSGTATDPSGNVYIADKSNQMIRKMTPAAVVTTLAGAHVGDAYADGTGSTARFASPQGVAADAAGNVYVADTNNHAIRKVTPAGVVTTIGGVGRVSGNTDGTGSAALFNHPYGIAIDTAGTLYIADADNNAIRKGVPAIGDSATIDASSGKPGTMRLLGVSPNTASTWLWEEIRRPSASAASLSSTSTPNPTFTPDVAGLYVFRLTASSSAGARVSTVSLSSGLFLPGDINGDGSVSAADIFYLINNLFAGGPGPVGPGDVNGDGSVTAADVFYLINYLFAGGSAPR